MISRPDYDKPNRCPGWSGPAARGRWGRRNCPGGTLGETGDRWWYWLPHRCPTCGLIVLPERVCLLSVPYLIRAGRRRVAWR